MSARAGGGAIRVFTDGASRGNPGHAGLGVVIQDAGGQTIEEVQGYLGQCTNNVAEYRALLAALDAVAGLKPAGVTFHLDSELVVRQINGQYKVRDAKMQLLYAEVMSALRRLPAWTVRHILREQNSRADQLANAAIDNALKGAQDDRR